MKFLGIVAFLLVVWLCLFHTSCFGERLNLSEVPLLALRVILDSLRRPGSFRKLGVIDKVAASMKQIQDGAGFAAWVLALAPVWILTACWQYTAVTRVCQDFY